MTADETDRGTPTAPARPPTRRPHDATRLLALLDAHPGEVVTADPLSAGLDVPTTDVETGLRQLQAEGDRRPRREPLPAARWCPHRCRRCGRPRGRPGPALSATPNVHVVPAPHSRGRPRHGRRPAFGSALARRSPDPPSAGMCAMTSVERSNPARDRLTAELRRLRTEAGMTGVRRGGDLRDEPVETRERLLLPSVETRTCTADRKATE